MSDKPAASENFFAQVQASTAMPEQPANPQPAHPDVDSMREDNVFLSRALRHPSTSFLVCNELQPLVQSSKERKVGGYLAFVKYDDVKPIIGDDLYEQPEKELMEQFNSDKYIPQMIFLGIDEKDKQGLEYQGKNKYTGAPYFAVDVTPQGPVKAACETLIKDLDARGLGFAQGRVMDIDASHGERFISSCRYLHRLTFVSLSCHLCRSKTDVGLECKEPVLCRLWAEDDVGQWRVQEDVPT